MKKLFQKSLLLICIFFSSSLFNASEKNNSEPASDFSEQFDQQAIDQLREEIEQTVTALRTETEKISFCLQQFIQALHANKLPITKVQKEQLNKELTAIQGFTSMLLKEVFLQTNPNMIQAGFIINNAMAKYLLKSVTAGITTIEAEKLQKTIDYHLQKDCANIKPETIHNIRIQNQKLINELLTKADFIGLTWYNKSFRFLKDNNAYDVARGTGVVLVSALIAACIYNSYYNTGNETLFADKGWLQACLDKIGKPGKIKVEYYKDEKGNQRCRPLYSENGDVLQDSGTGIGKLWDMYKSGAKLGLIGVTPLFTPPLKEFFTGMYYQYWVNAKTKMTDQWNRIDALCSGSNKKFALGDFEKAYFHEMTGVEHLEELAKRITNYLQHPERYERTQMEEHRGILLWGPAQTGKTLFVKALSTMISENFGVDKKIHFIDAKKLLDIDRNLSIDDIFYYAKSVTPCILFFDELDLVGANREKSPYSTGQLLTNMQGIDMASNKIFIVGATNKIEQLDKALLVDGRFGKTIYIGYPSYHHRKLYLEQQLAKRSIQLDPTFIDYIAQETEGASYNKLKRLITEALILSTNALRPVVQADFEKTLDTEIRKIEKFSTNVSIEEKRIIATHQAGKALMRHLLQTKQEVVKITILPVTKNIKANEFGHSIKTDQSTGSENVKLAQLPKEQKSKDGEVFTKTSTTNSALLSDDENKKESMCLLAGHVAHKVMFNKTFSQCNPQDRADAMQIIYTIISQGEEIDKHMRAKATEIKEQYEAEIMQLLTQHKTTLEMIIDKLVEQNSIDRYEWKELIKNCPTA